MNTVISMLIARFQSERGQALAEYALILAAIALACIIALGLIGVAVDGKLTSFSDELV
jgi:Flp pilus assembly pilin Flp